MGKLTTTSGAGRSSPGRPAVRRIVGALAAALAVAGFIVVAMRSSGSDAPASTAPCAKRAIVIDTSSADRGSRLTGLTDEVVQAAADSAIVCGDGLTVDAVTGGGEVNPVLNTADLAPFTPIGPDAQVRALRFGASGRSAVNDMVTRSLITAYVKSDDPSVTSVGALYEVAAQESTTDTSVTIVTTGVNDDAEVDLNEPLRPGQGAELAKDVAVPRMRAHSLTVVGIAQVDATTPPPSAIWPEQVLAFNSALCARAVVTGDCHLYFLPSVSQALGS